MKAVKVEYKVKPEFIDENKANIRKVMEALRANPIEGMYYATYNNEDDPGSFIHVNFAEDRETMSRLNEVPEFTAFRMALKASGPISPPSATPLEMVGMGFEV